MATEERSVEHYRDFLKVQVRLICLDQRLARRLDSSDLVQETMLRAHRRRAMFRGTSEAEYVRWLQRILENAAQDQIAQEAAGKRDYRREKSLDDLLVQSSARLEELLADRAAKAGEPLERQESVSRLFQALGSLPADQQDAVILRYLMELSIPEIAQRLDRSERSVAGLLFRGLKTLRQYRGYLFDDQEGEDS